MMSYENSLKERAKQCNLSPELLYKLRHKKVLTESEIEDIVKNYRFSFDYGSDSDESVEEGVPWNVKVDDSEEEEPKVPEIPSSQSDRCDVCNKTFKTKDYLNLHNERVHLKIRKIVCDYQDCGKEFYLKQALVNHKLDAHLHNEFRCGEDKCGKEFISKQGLKRHYTTKHLNKGKKKLIVVGSGSMSLHLKSNEPTLQSPSNGFQNCFEDYCRVSPKKEPKI